MGVGLQVNDISLAVRIVAFQAIDPGSNPGYRMYFLFLLS